MNSEESSFNPDHVEVAVLRFYKDPTNGNLNDYLTKAQLSTSAWTFVWAFLRIDKPLEVQIYGASSLYSKITKQWHEVPADFVISLRDRLFQLLLLYSDECHRIVFTNLCLCLSCFVLQTVTSQWSNALYELVDSVVNPPGENQKEKSVFQKNLLEILKTVPEEFLNSRVHLSEKSQVVNELINASNKVYELINKILVEDWPMELKVAAVKCFTNWCHSDICKFQPENDSLVIHLFELIKSQKHSLEAVDALAQFFKLQPNPNNSRVIKYLQLVTQLGSFFDQQSHNIELAPNLTKLFLSAAGNNLELLLSSITPDNEHSSTSLDLLQLILRTVAVRHQYPTEELYSDLSLAFWLNLHHKVIRCRENYPPLVQKEITSLLLNLIEISTTKIRYPPENVYIQWEDIDKEQFQCYRQKFANVAGHLTASIGSKSLDDMVHILKHQIFNTAEWQDFEVIFFIMNALLYNGIIVMVDCLSEIYTLISRIPCNHLNLTEEIIKFVGNYSSNVMHDLFDQSVAFVLSFFNQKAHLASASESLWIILKVNDKRINQVSEVVIQALKEAMKMPYIEPSISENLARCLGVVVSVVPHDLAIKVIQDVLMPDISVLRGLAAATQFSDQEQIFGIKKLKIMTGFFSEFSIPKENIHFYDFIFGFMTFMLTYIRIMITLIVQYEELLIEVIKFLDTMVLSLHSHFEMIVPKSCEIVQFAYSLNPLSCALNLAGILFQISHGKDKHRKALKSMYLVICEKSLQVIDQNPDEMPDLVRSFMDFMCSSSNYVKDFLELDPTCLSTFFRAAMRGVEMTNFDASTSSLEFLKVLIQNEDLTQIVKAEGQKLLQILLRVKFPIHDFETVDDIIIALHNEDRQFVAEKLTLILSSDSNVNEMEVSDVIRKLALL